jgi:hypothetical protein
VYVCVCVCVQVALLSITSVSLLLEVITVSCCPLLWNGGSCSYAGCRFQTRSLEKETCELWLLEKKCETQNSNSCTTVNDSASITHTRTSMYGLRDVYFHARDRGNRKACILHFNIFLITYFKTSCLLFVNWFKKVFCNISYVRHYPEDGHTSGRNM